MYIFFFIMCYISYFYFILQTTEVILISRFSTSYFLFFFMLFQFFYIPYGPVLSPQLIKMKFAFLEHSSNLRWRDPNPQRSDIQNKWMTYQLRYQTADEGSAFLCLFTCSICIRYINN